MLLWALFSPLLCALLSPLLSPPLWALLYHYSEQYSHHYSVTPPNTTLSTTLTKTLSTTLMTTLSTTLTTTTLIITLTTTPKFHILATRGEKSCILTIFGRILAILEDFLTEKKINRQKVKVGSCQYAWGAWPQFFHFQSGNASKFPKTDFYCKVTYFGHQGWKKLYYDNFWTHVSHFGGFPDWKGKNHTKGKSCVLSIRLGSMASVFSFSVRKCFKISKNWLLFQSYIFWPPGVKKVVFWPFLDAFRPFWRISWLKRKKSHKR